MKKEEVRIGNLVNITDNEGGEDKVIAIERDDCICYEYGAVDWTMVQGIPLSPEWLIRLGARKEEVSGYVISGATYYKIGSIRFYESDGKYYVPIGEQVSSDIGRTVIEFTMVHELQNIFALTGKELKP